MNLDLESVLRQTASALELAGFGYPDDAMIAGQLDISKAVPYIRDGAFIDLNLQLTD